MLATFLNIIPLSKTLFLIPYSNLVSFSHKYLPNVGNISTSILLILFHQFFFFYIPTVLHNYVDPQQPTQMCGFMFGARRKLCRRITSL